MINISNIIYIRKYVLQLYSNIMCLDGIDILLYLKALVHLSSCVQTCIVFSLYLFCLHIFKPSLGSAEILAADAIKVSRLIIGFRNLLSFAMSKTKTNKSLHHVDLLFISGGSYGETSV